MFGEDSGAPVEIGRYTVVERVGAGASGVVFKAFDEELERLVAIKVLSRDVTRDDKLRALALREGKSLAKLSHPHVVGIHEVGEHRGSLYFVMEFVRGGDLARWIAEQDRTKTDHAARAMALMVEAGRGLAAAHRAGIIHRDFKPANVLVAQDGRAKVADFGLARADPEAGSAVETTQGDSSTGPSTEEGYLAGTRAYMAPERFTGEPASERTDQFAFCVAAWEALSGERPWSRRPWAESEAPAVHIDGRLDPKVRKVLERGLARDPQERWPSMDALLERLVPKASWLSSTLGRGALALGIGGAAIAAAMRPETRCTGATDKMAELWTQSRADQVQSQVETLGLPFARDAWSRFRTDIDAYAEQWAQMHTDTCEATVVRKEQSEAIMELRMGCLRQAHQALASTLRAIEDPDREVMMRTHRLLEGLPKLSTCENVELLQADVRPPAEEDKAAVEEARGQLADAGALMRSAKYEEAAAVLEQAAPAMLAIDYPPLDGELAFRRGQHAIHVGKFEEAVVQLRVALDSATRLNRPVASIEAAIDLSDASIQLSKHESAQVYSDRIESLARRPNMPPEYEIAAHDRRGAVLRAIGKSDDALAEFQKAKSIAVEVFGAEHVETSLPLSNLAAVLYDNGDWPAAVEAYEEVLAVRVAQRGAGHPSVALTWNALCTIRVAWSRPKEALPNCRRALELFEATLPADHADIAMAKTNLGNALFDSGQREDGVEMARSAVKGWVAAVGAEHPNTGRARRALAHSLAQMDQLDEARKEIQGALEVFEQALGAEHPVVAQTRTSVATMAFQAGDSQEALRLYEDNRPKIIATMGEDNPHFATAELGRGKALAKLGRPEEARMALQTALAIRLKRFDADSDDVARIRTELSALGSPQ